MKCWKLHLEYEGTRYRGWQIQHNAKSVQGELTEAVRELFESRAEIYGSGRTDAGVHAVGQIVHLKVPELKTEVTPRQLQNAINDLLPHDINIKAVENASPEFHARHDALARAYVYQIATKRTAFGKNHVWWVKDRLDLRSMQLAAKMVEGKHDFVSFCEKEDGKKQSTVVKVDHSNVFMDEDLICFRIAASHFLWKMVRRITGMLVEVGRGNLGYDGFHRLIKFPSDVPAKFTAPPSGLFLEQVLYRGDKLITDEKAVYQIP
jgi:tRNA pseudouridine38-40 synthase